MYIRYVQYIRIYIYIYIFHQFLKKVKVLNSVFWGWGFFYYNSTNQPMLEKLGAKPYKYKLYTIGFGGVVIWCWYDFTMCIHSASCVFEVYIYIYDCMKIWICVFNISASFMRGNVYWSICLKIAWMQNEELIWISYPRNMGFTNPYSLVFTSSGLWSSQSGIS